jgi:hypothetical protein
VVFLNIEDLVPHEAVNLDHLRYVLKEIKSRGIVKPIIVDKVKNLVIDGHHRIEVLKLMGLKVVPAVIASYDRDIHRVDSWAYVANFGEEVHRLAREFLGEIMYSVKKGDKEVCMKIRFENTCISVDAIDFYLLLNEVSRWREFSIFSKMFKKTPFNHAIYREYDVCIVLPKLSVEDIYRVAMENLTLPPRTTYHRTYLKKVDMYIPLKFLAKISKRL